VAWAPKKDAEDLVVRFLAFEASTGAAAKIERCFRGAH